ncbi:MAG: ADP-ribosylglycohydrolase family protein, partial [Opitutales bacterium]
ELQQHTSPWDSAVATLRAIYQRDPAALKELDQNIQPQEPATGQGTGYVLDSLNSARWACLADDYETIIKRAISLGNDTDTTACIAGGIAGLRNGIEGIPLRWLQQLRSKEMLLELGLLSETFIEQPSVPTRAAQ